MKITRFIKEQEIRYGIVQDDVLIIAAGNLFDGLKPTSRKVPLEEVRLLPPVDPPNIFCIGRNYKAHAEERGSQLPDAPLMFLKPTTAVIGPQDPVVLPAVYPETIDYEAELAVVIGKKAKNVKKEDALSYVLGYTCANDISCRGAQKGDGQWTRGKGFDTFCPLGPVIQTEFDSHNSNIKLRLNGKIMQDSNTSRMIFPCDTLISYISHVCTLLPGTIILTGTPEGVGAARKPPVFLSTGDVVEVEIERIGVLKNPVIIEGEN